MAKKTKSKKKARDQKITRSHQSRPEPEKPIISWTEFFRSRWGILALLAVALGLYAMTWSYGYILDDKIVLSENQFVQKGFGGVVDIITTESMTGYFGEQINLIAGGRYRPLSIVTFAIEQAVFGAQPAVSHFVNSLLLGWTAVLIFYLCHLLWPQQRDRHWSLHLGWWAALFFVVHPVHTEVVANIKGRDEMMALIFSLHAAIACFKSRAISGYLLGGLFFYLGLLSKENAMTFLAVIPILIYYFRGGAPAIKWQHIAKVMGVLGGVLVLYLIQRYQIIGYLLSNGRPVTELMNQPFLQMTVDEKYATIMHTLLEYLRLLIWPHPLSHDYYPYAVAIKHWSQWTVLLSLVLHIGLLGYGIRSLWTRCAYGAFIWIYLATLSIVSNIPFTVGTLMNERFIYMSSVAFVMAACYALWHRTSSGRRRHLVVGLSVVLVVVGGILTTQRLPVWGDNIKLNASAVAARPGSARAQMFYGTALFKEAIDIPKGDAQRLPMLEKAMHHIDKSLQIYPSYGNGNNMRAGLAAKLFEENGDIAALLAHFIEIVKVRPRTNFMYKYLSHLNSLGGHQQALKTFYMQAGYDELISSQQDIPMGLKMLKKGLEMSPSDPDIRAALYDVYMRTGRPGEAEKYR